MFCCEIPMATVNGCTRGLNFPWLQSSSLSFDGMTLERAIDFPFVALITTAKTWTGGHGIAEAARSDADPWQERLRGNRTVQSHACCCQARADA